MTLSGLALAARATFDFDSPCATAISASRLYNMTGDIVMSLLILDDATKAPEMFAKSANVYVRMAEEEVLGHSAYIQNFKAEDLESFKA